MRRRDTVQPADDWGSYERLRLGCALVLDALPGIGSNPAAPPEGFMRRLADELGVAVDVLLGWGAAQGVARCAASHLSEYADRHARRSGP